MPPLTWLITGSNRGIGLTLVRQLLQEPSNIVLAACRSPHTASHLHRLSEVSPGRLNVLQLDVTDLASITASVDSAKEVIGEHGLDYLVNNAGVGLRSDPMFDGETVQWADWLAYSLKVNTVGPALITKSYLPLLEKSRRPGVVMNISSRWSSFGRQGGAFSPTYSITKAALNMLTYKQAQERPNLIFFAMSPGWVQTEMGGPNAESTADESASALLSFAKRADKEHSGKLFDQDGSRMDW